MGEAAAVRSVTALAQDLSHAITGLDQSDQCAIVYPLGAVPNRVDVSQMARVQPEHIGPPHHMRDAAIPFESEADREVTLTSRKRDVVTQVRICPRT